MLKDRIAESIRKIKDFPKEGIIYQDITTFLKNGKLFAEYIDFITEKYKNNIPDYIVGVESRGFIFGAVLAYKLGCGFIPVRKAGKLPGETISVSYDLEYGSATVEIHKDAIHKGDKVLIFDDLLATGGTVSAAIKLIEKLGGDIISVEFLIELAFLKGRKQISYPVDAILVV